MAIKKSEKSTEIKINLISQEGKKKSELTIQPKENFTKKHFGTIHDIAVMQLANRRRGTAHVKTRAEVNKTGHKPWKQKGTGNARAGTAGSPLWVGGGVAHGPRTRDWSYSAPKKVRRLALASSVVQKMKDNEVIVVDEIKLKEPKTKLAAQFLDKIQARKNALLITAKSDPILNRAFRNIPKIGTTTVSNLTTLDVLKYQKLVMTREVFEQVSALVQGGEK